MTTPVLVTVSIPSTSGLAEDAIVNDLVFEMTTFDGGAADDLRDAIADFYNVVQTIPGTDFSVANFISDAAARTTDGVGVNFYDLTGFLDGSAHGSPSFVRSFTLGAPASAGLVNLPNEVAVALSFHGDLDGIPETAINPTPPPAKIRPAARRRGRTFIGPLNVNASDQTSGNRPRVGAPLQDALAAAATTLLTADANSVWSVWSRTDEVLYPVVGGWVDDAFDTIRARGIALTGRTLWP